MGDEEKARAEIVAVCQRIYEKGWVANHDGNASIRVSEARIIATPTAVSKGDVKPEWLIVVDPTGKKLEGTRRGFSEFSLHLKAYGLRPDVKAVLHAHPPTACGFAVAGLEIDPTCMPEAVVSIGDRIPLTPCALPFGEEGAAPLGAVLEDYDAVVMANHGVLTVGPDMETAFLRMELVEHLARIQLVARQLGQVNTLSPTHLKVLLEKRTKAGLGPEARGRGPASGVGVARPLVGEGPGSSGGFGSPAPSAWGDVRAPVVRQALGPAAAPTSVGKGGPPYPRSLCSGEVPSVATDAQLEATRAALPSGDALKALVDQELKRILGA